MPITGYHVFTSPVADGTNTQLVRPSNWNSNHLFTANLSGSEVSGAFDNGGGVTFGLATNGFITAAAPAGGGGITNINVSAGTTSNNLSRLTFADSNGLSFGLNGSVITGTHNALTQQSTQPVAISGSNGSFAFSTVTMGNLNGLSFYTSNGSLVASHNGLTTAALSDHSHGNPTLALTNLSGTTASNSGGFTLSLSAGAGGAGDGVNILAAGTQTANTTGTVLFNNGNGITFGMSNNSVITASHNGLTTARASNDAIGLGTALTAGPLAWTVNSNGLSLNAGSAAGTTSGFAGNSISGSITHNTAGINISLNHPAWLTTAAQSSVSNVSGVIAGTASNGGTATLSGNVSFSNANGISFYTSAGNAIVATVKTDYLTTAANSTHSHGNPTLALTNINGTTASASNGLTLSLSAIVPAQSAMGFSGSNGSFTASTLSFGASNGLTFYTTNGSIVASYTDAGAGGGVNFSAGTTSANLAAVTFANGGGVSFGLNAGTITASVNAAGGGATYSTYIPYYPASTQSQTVGAKGVTTASAYVFPVSIQDPIAFNELRMIFSNSHNSSSVSGRFSVWSQFGIYSRNGSTLSQISSGSFSMDVTASSGSCTYQFPTATGTGGYTYGTVSASATAQAQSLFGSNGNRLVGLQFGNTMSLTPGLYWLGVHQRQSTSSANVGMSTAFIGNAFNGVTNAFLMGSSTAALGTNTKYNWAWGFFTSTGLAGHSGTNLPTTMAISGISMASPVVPLVTFIST